MITEFDVVPAATLPGEKLQVHEVKLLNASLHQVVLHSSKAIMSLIEMPSNNTLGGMSKKDAVTIQASYSLVAKFLELAETDRNLPEPGGHEHIEFAALPTGNQVMMIGNVRAQSVAMAYRDLCLFCLNADSSKQRYDIGDTDLANIKEHLARVKRMVDLFVGNVTVDGEFQRGHEVPVYTHLGDLQPPASFGRMDAAEPSADRPEANPRPDVADVPSKTPAPLAGN